MGVKKAVALVVVLAGVGAAVADEPLAAGAESFSVSVDLDLATAKKGQVLFEVPGKMTLGIREAGEDPVLRDYDRRLGNYLNFPRPDGTCPVFEAELPDATRQVLDKERVDKLPRGWRVGFPLSLLKPSPRRHTVRVEFARTALRVYADGRLMDEDYLTAAPAWIADAKLPPAPPERPAPDAVSIDEPIQYWTAGGFNTWVGDVVVKTWRGRLHVFYLRDRRHHHGKFGTGGHLFAHISSADLVRWQEHPDVAPIDRYWMTYGTGTAFEMNGRLCLSYGFHSTRYVPVEKTTEPAMLKELAATGVMPHVRYAGTDLVPLGTSWAESADGIRFTPSGILCHTTQNPGIENLPDGRLRLTTGYFADSGAKGQWIADGMTGWKVTPSKPVLSGDCPCPFSWNGYDYLLQGFFGYAWAKTGEPLAVARGTDVYDGICVPMVAPWRDAAGRESRRLLVGWIGHFYGWGGWLVFRELVQRPDGTLGTKWVDEIPPPSPVTKAVVRGDCRLDFATADGKDAYRFVVDAKKGTADLLKVAADGTAAPYGFWSRQKPVSGIRGLEGDYAVRYVLHYDAKADATVFDAEIAGNRTLVVAIPGRLSPSASH